MYGSMIDLIIQSSTLMASFLTHFLFSDLHLHQANEFSDVPGICNHLTFIHTSAAASFIQILQLFSKRMDGWLWFAISFNSFSQNDFEKGMDMGNACSFHRFLVAIWKQNSRFIFFIFGT